MEVPCGVRPIARSDAPEVAMADPLRIRGGLRRVETTPFTNADWIERESKSGEFFWFWSQVVLRFERL